MEYKAWFVGLFVFLHNSFNWKIKLYIFNFFGLTALVKRTMESLQQTTALEVPLKVAAILNFHYCLPHI